MDEWFGRGNAVDPITRAPIITLAEQRRNAHTAEVPRSHRPIPRARSNRHTRNRPIHQPPPRQRRPIPQPPSRRRNPISRSNSPRPFNQPPPHPIAHFRRSLGYSMSLNRNEIYDFFSHRDDTRCFFPGGWFCLEQEIDLIRKKPSYFIITKRTNRPPHLSSDQPCLRPRPP